MNKLGKTKIPYADYGWHITTGCDGVSEGCKNCWARSMSRRFPAVFGGDFSPRFHPDRLPQPLNTKKPGIVFVAPMGDFTNIERPNLTLMKGIISLSDKIFLLLTKKPKDIIPYICESEKVWTGVSVESAEHLDRIYSLPRESKGRRFVSFEPLLGEIPDGDWINHVDWVIAGGEQASNARECKPEWIINLWQICHNKNIPFFFKQWGSNYACYPEDDSRIEKIREYPQAFNSIKGVR